MPMYEFVHKPTGERREEFFGMEDAPVIGARIRRDGRQWTRVVSRTQLAPVWSREFVAHSQTPWDPDAPHYAADGTPAFRSQREVDEYAARKGMVYDDGRIGRHKGKKVADNRRKGS